MSGSPEHRLDLGRRQRLGMVEAIWGEHKSAEQIGRILEELQGAGELALVTRISPEKAAAVAALLGPERGEAWLLQHHPQARCLSAGLLASQDSRLGRVAVLSGGTSDLPVAAEAQLALACHGIATELVLDVGVAGLHRLLERLEDLRHADVLIACAGMEGALPTVLAGLLPQPVIGVPVAVGYGVSAGGVAALHGMWDLARFMLSLTLLGAAAAVGIDPTNIRAALRCRLRKPSTFHPPVPAPRSPPARPQRH